MHSLLITGGAGFIGSNFIIHFLQNNKNYHLINFDALTYAADVSNLEEINRHARYTFVKGDITERAQVEKIFSQYEIAGVIHFAAESHVDNSIAGPEAFIKTNINGTFNLLDVARHHWMKAPFQKTERKKNNRFLHISTDEVFGSLGPTGLFTETSPYAPNSPYSASKAASDLLVRSYFHTYGLNVVTTNCSNNYGPHQHQEKLIPTIIRTALAEKPIPIYGDGLNVRDWLYVLDHVRGIELAFKKGKAGETYNIGGKNERTNNQIVQTVCSLLNELHPRKNKKPYQELITYVQDRAGHDKRYAIDASKIEKELGWKAEETFESAIRQTIKWYLKKFN
ncbi:MAG: dTDP-glucose 4,6-dehydratase [Cytophagales bacterium]|jgi:dTDP-glucose 4,6-dehydratase|nr:dTDP-glucose 4,6-dehydratase [Bacteroidota bacterium]WHZ07597.1 MAG: dTDP-glucose 4,6-dehydratase [Cytophagales bacterium]